jgi:biotin transport system substrate-specific component
MMGFVSINIPSPLNIGTHATAYNQLTMIQYSFQIPTALFVGAFLGPFMGTAAVLLLLVIGLAFFPIFANGGGWHYTSQPGFGYLLGALIVACLLGKSFYKAFQKEGNTSRSLKIILNAVFAVLLVHALGGFYMVGLAITKQVPFAQVPGWILRLTIETMPYDIVVTAVFLCLVRQIRLALWLVLY